VSRPSCPRRGHPRRWRPGGPRVQAVIPLVETAWTCPDNPSELLGWTGRPRPSELLSPHPRAGSARPASPTPAGSPHPGTPYPLFRPPAGVAPPGTTSSRQDSSPDPQREGDHQAVTMTPAVTQAPRCTLAGVAQMARGTPSRLEDSTSHRDTISRGARRAPTAMRDPRCIQPASRPRAAPATSTTLSPGPLRTPTPNADNSSDP
jgi:hypothetical protein